MLEKLLQLCDNENITFELSTWYRLMEGKNRIVMYGIGNTYVEFYEEDMSVLIEIAIKEIEKYKNSKQA